MIQEKEKQSQAETQEQGENWMQIAFAAQSENEGFARTAVVHLSAVWIRPSMNWRISKPLCLRQ